MEKIDLNLNRQSTMTNSPNSDIYIGEDGIKYCSKCHTRRETAEIVPFLNRRMPVMCECMQEAERKRKEQEEYRKKMEKLEKLRSASLLGERYKNTTFDSTDTTVGGDFMKAYKRCRKYCEVSSEALQNGYGIYLYGNSGTGKTHLTACICNELLNNFQQCLFTNFFEISKMIRATFNRHNANAETVIQRICEIDFLFIDDLGTEALQRNGEDNWLQEQVFDIINKRYNNKKPTIFSSNHSLGELMSERGMMQKTVERIMEMSTAIIKIEGQSYRMKNRRKEVPF